MKSKNVYDRKNEAITGVLNAMIWYGVKHPNNIKDIEKIKSDLNRMSVTTLDSLSTLLVKLRRNMSDKYPFY